MKKFWLVFTMIVALFVTSACADEVDLSSMSDDDLDILFEELIEEMRGRGIVKNGELAPGSYVVGKDIVEGSYNLTCVGESYSKYFVFDSVEQYNAYSDLSKSLRIIIHNEEDIDVDEYVKLDLTNNQVLMIEYEPVELSELKSSLTP